MEARPPAERERRRRTAAREPDAAARAPAPAGPDPQAVGMIVACALILLVVAGSVLSGGEADGAGEPLEPLLVTTGEWAPYSGASLPGGGVAAALVTAVFRQMGYQPDFRFLPWERAEIAARESGSDNGVRAAFPYWPDADRARDFYYSDAILTVELSIFYDSATNPAGAGIDSIGDLQDFRIVPIRGYRYPPEFRAYLDSLTLAGDNVEAFELLVRSQRPLVVLEATEVGEALLDGRLAAHAGRIRAAPDAFPSEIHLIASKRNPNNLPLIRRFDRDLARLRESGRLAQIEAAARDAADQRHTVELRPITPGGRIDGYASRDGAEAWALPRGTRAVVLQWSANHLEPRPAEDRAYERVHVRILNGPQSGKDLFVDERTIVLP